MGEMKVVTRIWLVFCSLQRSACNGPEVGCELGKRPTAADGVEALKSIPVPILCIDRGMRYSARNEDFPASSLLESIMWFNIRLTVFELRAPMAVNVLIATQTINSSRKMQSKCLTQLKRKSARSIQCTPPFSPVVEQRKVYHVI